jgi:hypothetical protein
MVNLPQMAAVIGCARAGKAGGARLPAKGAAAAMRHSSIGGRAIRWAI